MTERDLALRVEEACLNAWPALRQVFFDGWLLRFSHGLTRRANSVNPLHPGSLDLRKKIAACEFQYRAQGLPTIFRLPSIIEQALDPVLEILGYRAEGETLVRYLDLTGFESREEPGVEMHSLPSPQWLFALARYQGQSEQQRDFYRRIVEALAVPSIFAATRHDGHLVSLAYGAIHDQLVCLESVVTDPIQRRAGFAQRTVSAILSWAREQGAKGASVQVEANNAPAIALYTGVGFRAELYRYHYRRKPLPPPLA